MSIRSMTEADLPVCLSFTQQVKWPHRSIDWQLHFELGHGSVIEANLDSDNAQSAPQIVGCILWWDYPALNNATGKASTTSDLGCATVGLVVVPDAMQGRGLGRTLMNTVMEQAGERNLQLVATVAGKRLYEQCGFTTRSTIYQVQGELTTQPDVSDEFEITDVDASSLSTVIELDNQAFQANRSALLKALVARGKCVIASQNGQSQGYAFIRESGRGETIGPVVASDADVAKALAAALLQQAKGFVRFDLTEHASDLKSWLTDLGLQQVDEVSLMVKGEWLAEQAADYQVYSLASQAFG